MRSSIRRRARTGTRAGAVVALAVLAASGCAQGSTPADTVAVAHAASAKTLAAGSADVHLTVGVQGFGVVPDGRLVDAEGAFSFTDNVGHLTMTMPESLGGAQLGELEIIQSGHVLYERLPAQLATTGHLKPWLKVDLDQIGSLAGVDVSTLMQAQSSDPSQLLQQLQGMTDDVHAIGTKTVGTERLQGYSVVVDLGRAATALGSKAGEAIKKYADQVGISTYPATLWVDDHGRLRDFTATIDLGKAGIPQVGEHASETITLKLDHFGTPVAVQVPTADETSDVTALLGSLGGTLHG